MIAAAHSLHVLALNSGSSTLKFGLFRVSSSHCVRLFGSETERPQDVIARVAKLLAESHMPPPAAIGHRLVHGGPELRAHCRIDEAVLRRLEAASAFAPLHMPASLALIRSAQLEFPQIPQTACFDTAFHNDLPDVARVLPIPKEWRAEGIERYGFHGLSCESIVNQLTTALPLRSPDRIVIAHLGNGASVTAIQRGKSIDTSMGLTPSGGVIMGTRSGDLDPGVLTYLMREKHYDSGMLADLIDRRSGMLGISGVDSDMRRLHEVAASNTDAQLAIQMFCYSVRKQIAGMIAALNGVDVIVFTGGIGEHDFAVRAEICNGLSWLGVSLDAARNRTASNPISTAASSCAVYALASQEEQQIARHTWTLVSG